VGGASLVWELVCGAACRAFVATDTDGLSVLVEVGCQRRVSGRAGVVRFEEDDASSDVDGVVAEPFVEPSEEGDVDCCLYSVWPLRCLGDGEQAPVQLVHDSVGGDNLLSASIVKVVEYDSTPGDVFEELAPIDA
jgi:hypothetical protein